MNEAHMWVAVIHQALHDAINGRPKARREARDWLANSDGDFAIVCALADLEADKVRKHAETTIAEADARDLPTRRRCTLVADARDAEIVRLAALGMTQRAIADCLGTTQATVWKVLKQGRGVVADFAEERRDRRGCIARDSAEIGISSHPESEAA